MMWYDSSFLIPLSYGVGKNTRKKLNTFKNVLVFQNTFFRNMNDIIDSIDIENLPDTMSKRVIMQSLIWYASVVIFEKNGGIYALPGVPSGDGYNANGDPASGWVFSRNGMLNEEVKLYLPGADEGAFLRKTNAGLTSGKPRGVIVWDNAMRYPLINDIIYLSEQIADSLRTIESSRRNLKNPFIIVCDESLVKTVNKFFEDRDNNECYVMSSGSFTPDRVVMLPIATQANSINDCVQLVEWYENKARERAGLNSNGNMDKKGENLISDEIHINDEYESLQIDKRIAEINKGFDFANKLFGLNLKAVRNERIAEDISRNTDGDGSIPGDNTDRTQSDNQ